MGWDSCEAWKTTDDVIASVARDYAGRILAQGVVKHQGQTNAWFAIVVEGRPMAMLALIERENRRYAVKTISEDMGPYYYRVPRAVWDAVKDYPAWGDSSERWRERVIAV